MNPGRWLRQCGFAALLLGLLAPITLLAQAQIPQTKAQTFEVASDIPSQRQGLLALLASAGNFSVLHDNVPYLALSGLSGNSAWGRANVSYCNWWGVTCCGTALTQTTPVCQQGPQSVAGLDVSNANLIGRLPDVFGAFSDLQALDISANRALIGSFPASIGGLSMLWRLDTTGTSMDCSDYGLGGWCPLPPWLMFDLELYYVTSASLWCPEISFSYVRYRADRLARIYGSSNPVLEISPTYYHRQGCQNGSADMFASSQGGLSQSSLIAVIVVPALAVSACLALASFVIMRYLGHLKASHDAVHLTDAWKRRNPPGLIANGNDKVLREITLVITDVEGSTELWEWDYGIMAVALEIHDNILRELISKYCGYEVTTEGDSFTIAFHDAFDATAWALHVQAALLAADWPAALLAHPRAATVHSSETNSSRPGQLLFRGLRVRVAVNTGIPISVRKHELTSSLVYTGPVVELATSMSELPAGGQVLVGSTTFSSVSCRLAELGHRLADEGALPKCLQPDAGAPPAADSPSSALAPAPSSALSSSPPSQNTPWWQRLAALRRSSMLSSPSSKAAASYGRSAHMGGRLSSLGRRRSSSMGRRFGSLVLGQGDLESQEVAFVADKRGSFWRPSAPPALLPSPWAAADLENTPMIIDMGSHWLEGLTTNTTSRLTVSYVSGIRLTQVVMRRLAPRAALFPPLQTTRQLHPSYFDAPSAADALLPDGLRFISPSMPVVTIAFCGPDALRPLELTDPRAAKEALAMYCSAVRTTLNACRGYECQEKDGMFMLAFHEPASAVEWACLLQLALLRLRWSMELLSSPCGEEVMDPATEQLLFRGVRARVGVYRGDITRIIPHKATGRADFFGPCVNRAARFLSAAAPGQVFVEKGVAEEVRAAWQAGEQAVLETLPANSTTAPGISTRILPLRRNSASSTDARALPDASSRPYDHQGSFDRAMYPVATGSGRHTHFDGAPGSGRHSICEIGGGSGRRGYSETGGHSFGCNSGAAGSGRERRASDSVYAPPRGISRRSRLGAAPQCTPEGGASEAGSRRPSFGAGMLRHGSSGRLAAFGAVQGQDAPASGEGAAGVGAGAAAPVTTRPQQQPLEQQQQAGAASAVAAQAPAQAGWGSPQPHPPMFQHIVQGVGGRQPSSTTSNGTGGAEAPHQHTGEHAAANGSSHSGTEASSSGGSGSGIGAAASQAAAAAGHDATAQGTDDAVCTSAIHTTLLDEGGSAFAAAAKQPPLVVARSATDSGSVQSFSFAPAEPRQASSDASVSLSMALGSTPPAEQHPHQQRQRQFSGHVPPANSRAGSVDGWRSSVGHADSFQRTASSSAAGASTPVNSMEDQVPRTPSAYGAAGSGFMDGANGAEVSFAASSLPTQTHHQQQHTGEQEQQQQQQAGTGQHLGQSGGLRIASVPSGALRLHEPSMLSPFASVLMEMEEQEQHAGPLPLIQQGAAAVPRPHQPQQRHGVLGQQRDSLQQQEEQEQQGQQVAVQPALGKPRGGRGLRENRSFCMADESTMEPNEAFASFDTAGEELGVSSAHGPIADGDDGDRRGLVTSPSGAVRQRLHQAMKLVELMRSSTSSDAGDTPRAARRLTSNISWARGTPLPPMPTGADSDSSPASHGGLRSAPRSPRSSLQAPAPGNHPPRMRSSASMPRVSATGVLTHPHSVQGSAGSAPGNLSAGSTRGPSTGGASAASTAANSPRHSLALPQTGPGLPASASVQNLVGGVPLEAVPTLRLRMNRRQSFALHAMTDAAQRRHFERVAVAVQMHDMGAWTFKGINGQHEVVQVVPAPVAGRLHLGANKKSGKAFCQRPGKGLLGVVWVTLADLDSLLFTPYGELGGAGTASVRHDRLSATYSVASGRGADGDVFADRVQGHDRVIFEAQPGWEPAER